MLVFCYSRLDGCPDRLMDEPVKHSEPKRKIRKHNSLMGGSVLSALVASEAQAGPDPPLPSSNEAGDANCTAILGDQASSQRRPFKNGALPSFVVCILKRKW